jgi:hypothetical protein
MSVPSLRPLAFGEILDGAFTLYRRHFVTFFCTALIPMLVMIVAFKLLGTSVFAMILGEDTRLDANALAMGLLLIPVGFLTFLVMWGALARQTSQSYLEQPTSLGDGFRAGVRAFFPLLGAAVAVFTVMVVVFFAVGILMGIVAAMGVASESQSAVVVVTLIAFLFGMVVYLGALALLFAVLPAVVVERKGPLDALGRSFDLAKGAIWRIVGLMLVTLLITYLPGFAVMALTGGFANILQPDQTPSVGQFMNQQMLGLAVNILTTPFMVAVMVLQYFDRRVRTEALDVQMAADRLSVATGS